ncbi:hypothetical protein [Cohnella sp. 56]|uniref:hypothetical protein n=1 Tax=Cohnella sp. 56 TaxID=3113722 RepID=UPI0030E93E64
MEKKKVLTMVGTFVIGVVGGVLLMMSDDAYKAVSGAVGNSTGNALALAQQQNLAAQNALTQASKQRDEQLGQIVQNADVLKKQADLLSQQQSSTIGSIGGSISNNASKEQEKSKQDAAQKAEEAVQQQQQQQQQQLQQQMMEMIQQIQQFLQQMKESEAQAMKALTKV